MKTSQKLSVGVLVAGSLAAGAFGGQQLQPNQLDSCEIPIIFQVNGEDKQICVTADEYAAVEAYLKGQGTVQEK